MAAGKPFLRVPLNKKAAPKKTSENRPAGDPMKAVDRANRAQTMEAEEMKKMKMMKKPMKKYAKGGTVGAADGCAKKGKTHTKMVKMAMGGSTGLARAAAMSGRSMPSGGRGAMMAPQKSGGRANFKSGGSCGMKKGK